MSDFTTIDIATRLEVHELFNRYCHLVDHDHGPAWAALFTPDGSFAVTDIMKLEGHEQLAAMPGIVQQQGGGKWRHQVTNIVIDPGDKADALIVTAYGLVTDWRDGGSLASFTDYRIVLRRTKGWKIAELVATPA